MNLPTKDELKSLAEVHIRRYSFRLEQAKKGVRTYTMDAGVYLSLWRSMEAKEFDWTKFTIAEKYEAMEALADG